MFCPSPAANSLNYSLPKLVDCVRNGFVLNCRVVFCFWFCLQFLICLGDLVLLFLWLSGCWLVTQLVAGIGCWCFGCLRLRACTRMRLPQCCFLSSILNEWPLNCIMYQIFVISRLSHPLALIVLPQCFDCYGRVPQVLLYALHLFVSWLLPFKDRRHLGPSLKVSFSI